VTRDDVINRFAIHYNDCDNATAILLFNEVHGDVLQQVQDINSSTTISLTAGQREYTLPDTVIMVNEAYYQDSATESSWYKLVPTSIQELSAKTNWRAQAQQVRPTEYYITTAVSGNTGIKKIGFRQIPPTTTSAGYPNVTLFGTVNPSNLAGSDNLPSMISYPNVYVYGMCRKYAIMRQPEKYPIYQELYQKELDLNIESSKGMEFMDEGTFLSPQFLRLGTRGR